LTKREEKLGGNSLQKGKPSKLTPLEMNKITTISCISHHWLFGHKETFLCTVSCWFASTDTLLVGFVK